MPYKLFVLLSSLTLAAVFTVVGWNLYGQIDEYFEAELTNDSARLHSIYKAQSEELARHAQDLAYGLSANSEIQRLLEEADRAVRIERAHRGNNDVARVARVRRLLYEKMKHQWGRLQGQHEVQHLQFLLLDGTSFLRMEATTHYGDISSASDRAMLADIVRDHKPHGGFEIDRTYAGILGVSAVNHSMPNAEGLEHDEGIVEVGFDMSKILHRLDRQLNVGLALLLDEKRTSNFMLADYRPSEKIDQYYILAASRPDAEEWLRAGLLPVSGRSLQNRVLKWKERTFHLITFGLDDYQSQLNPSSSQPGSVLIWRDITDQTKRLRENHTAVIINTLAAWVLAQSLLLALLHGLRRGWEHQLKKKTSAIENLLQYNALLLDTAANGICGIDKNGCITFINRTALAMHGFQSEEAMGKKPHELFYRYAPDGRPNPAKSKLFMQTIEDGMPREAEEWLFRRDGSCFPAKMVVTPIFEMGQTNGAVIVFHDITEQRNRQEALLRLATTDSLTGVSNRRHFLDQLDAELARLRRHGGQASILMTDLDFFKHINDEHGHATGDAVLSHFVHIIRETVRRSDIIGRLGGEEFAILLPGDGTNGARELAERLRRSFESNPTKVNDMHIACTVSIGISNLRASDTTADAPLRRADEALYAAKAAGRNRTELYDRNLPPVPPDPESADENTISISA